MSSAVQGEEGEEWGIFQLTCELVPLRHVRPDSQPSFQPTMEVEVYESFLMDRIVHSLSCYFPDKRFHILSDKKKSELSAYSNWFSVSWSFLPPLLQFSPTDSIMITFTFLMWRERWKKKVHLSLFWLPRNLSKLGNTL